MILILILSDATYNFEIRFVAIIHYLKTCIVPKTILSVERSVCWRVGPMSARWHARTNLTPSLYCVQIGLSTWVEPYKSDSGQFCLPYNRIKYELKNFFSADFRSQLSLFLCIAFVSKKKIYNFFHYMILWLSI